MSLLVLDTETTTRHVGSPFDRRNRLCAVSTSDGTRTSAVPIEHGDAPYGDTLRALHARVLSASLVVGFNLKFDLHWLRRYGILLDVKTQVWDCQLAEFILSGQSITYPSLNEVAASYGLGSKVSNVLENYWSVGIDTPEIPWDELEEYANRDVQLTYEVFLKQRERVAGNAQQLTLINLSCLDMLVLEEMEWNGLKFDLDLAHTEAARTQEQLNGITAELNELVGVPDINWNSGDHISAVLYGGSYVRRWKEPVGVYATGLKIGEMRYRWHDETITLPRLVEPAKGSELKKDGFFATNSKVLRNLPATGQARKIISALLAYSQSEKLLSTYYLGIPDLAREYEWDDSIIHGSYNQVVARTGRLSSSNPNLQNIAGDADALIISRY